MLGPDPEDSKEGKYLNRTIRYERDGISYAHDSKHVQTILRETGVLEGKGVISPGCRHDTSEDEEQKLNPSGQHQMGRLIAVLNYLAQDRVDIAYAVKECARTMSSPTVKSQRMVLRIARYLLKRPSFPQMFWWQDKQAHVTVYSDADWASCTKTRRSTSGGVMMHGCHVVKHWSRTQGSVALSSGESELIALVKGSCEILGFVSLCSEMGLTVTPHVLTDSSAAKGAVSRVGTGRMKHVATQSLWVQERVAKGDLTFFKVPRSENFSDFCTHHWDPSAAFPMLRKMGFVQ